ncbi:MAG: beta-propeller domain-containing protein [Nostocaceae cyanobacterium]|nr:beta-propeller domain-containing protein [Nostocaceae cyanobacterium]
MAKINSLVFEDLNADGIQDAGELGIQGVTVKLLDRRDNILATTTTDAEGIYTFDDLGLGRYKVMFDNPDDGVYKFSPRQVGNNSAIDSDGPISDLFWLRNDEFNDTIDAGLYREVSQNPTEDSGNGDIVVETPVIPENEPSPTEDIVVETPIIPQNEPSPTFSRFNSEGELEQYLVDDALKKYSNLFGKEFSFGIYPYYDYDFAVDISGNLATTDSLSFSATGDFSETNTQEEGVDESDLVETNGDFIYQVTGGDLTIVDARNPEQLSIASETDLKDLGNIQGAYLYQDKLTVISTASPWQFWSTSFINYNPTSFNPTVNVSVFDVSDPTSVVLEEKSELDGYLLSSRAVGDQVYVVTQAAFGLPQPRLIFKEQEPATTSDPVDTSKEIVDISQDITLDTSKVIDESLLKDFVIEDIIIDFPIWEQRYETEEEYLARLEGQVLEEGLPNFTTVDSQGQILQSGLLNEAENIYKPLEDKPVQLTSVSVFDVDDTQAGIQSSTGIFTSGAREVYASLDNLYLLEPDAANTDILKVNLDTLDLAAIGEAPGRVLNQFSVDEEQGFLRVATSTGFNNSSENHLYVLEQQGQNLEIVGSVEGIAPGERMYSARFEGDKGFMVTFVEKDPFFTFDLSEPTNPKLVGELELPGFSNYLQVIENQDNTQVLGIGSEGNDLKVTLFDVTDLKNPQEVDSFVFEGRYSSSEARFDQQAVSYFPEYETLAIPFQGTSGKGLRVFDVDAQSGFSTKGDIIHEGGRIRRSLRIGNDLYAISNERVTVHDLDSLELKSEVILSDSTSPLYPTVTIDPTLLSLTAVESIAPVESNVINDSFSLGTGDNVGSVSITQTDDMVSVSASASSGITDGNQLGDFASISAIKTF